MTFPQLLGIYELLKLIAVAQGLNDAADKHGFQGEGFAYLKMPLWWAGILTRETTLSFSAPSR
jgi:hypothetical protein